MKLAYVNVEKSRGLRHHSNYNFINYLKLTTTILVRFILLNILIFLLPISLVLFLMYKFYLPLLSSTFLIILAHIFLILEKVYINHKINKINEIK